MKRNLCFLLVLTLILSLAFSAIGVSAETTAPEPDQIKVEINAEGVAVNSVASSPYKIDKADASVTPDVQTDAKSGNKYLYADPNVVNGFYVINEQNSPQTTFFWKNFWKLQRGDTVDLSFTMETLIMVPVMPTSATYLIGYTSSGKGGFGIGLCTAREFARAMGGDLTVRPNDPKGCVFTLSLPLHSP